MTTLDTSKSANLTIETRKGVSLTVTVRNEALNGATYAAKVYADNNTELFSLNVAPSGQNLILSHAQITADTGVYRYTLTRTSGPTIKRILEGSFIIKP